MLQVATGEPAFEPWVVDDDPTNGEGFESAVVYAVAEELGIDEDAVTWIRTGFDEAIAPGEKDYDFNVQQFGITPERDEVVDFSDGYYEVQQAIVGRPTTATSPPHVHRGPEGRQPRRGHRHHQPRLHRGRHPARHRRRWCSTTTPPPRPRSTPTRSTASSSTCRPRTTSPPSEIADSVDRRRAAPQGDAEELGFLFEDGSPLVPCVNEALATLKDDGTLADLQEEWLNQGGDIPTLEQLTAR